MLIFVQIDGEEGELVDLAIKTVEMLAAVKPAADKGGGDAEVGAGLSGGELPMAQATVLCILRVGIIERLGETGQARPPQAHRMPRPRKLMWVHAWHNAEYCVS